MEASFLREVVHYGAKNSRSMEVTGQRLPLEEVFLMRHFHYDNKNALIMEVRPDGRAFYQMYFSTSM